MHLTTAASQAVSWMLTMLVYRPRIPMLPFSGTIMGTEQQLPGLSGHHVISISQGLRRCCFQHSKQLLPDSRLFKIVLSVADPDFLSRLRFPMTQGWDPSLSSTVVRVQLSTDLHRCRKSMPCVVLHYIDNHVQLSLTLTQYPVQFPITLECLVSNF